ncbi:MAG: hypothetical protein K6F56_10560 [Oscillospiraceae bacterium]|nr:hypothetical protein [Oscillospiraceae bacterium]
MKKSKRLIAVLLIVVMTLALAGCGFVSQMTMAVWKMGRLRSYRMDMDMDMEIIISVLGQSMNMDMELGSKSDISLKPERTKSTMSVGMFGEEFSVLSYTDKTDKQTVTYSSQDGGKTWSKQTEENKAQDKKTNKQSFTALLKLASGFEKTGTETVRGSEATVYAGVINGADLASVTEVSEALGNAFSAMNMSAEDLKIEDLGTVPVTIAIDNKSSMIVRYTLDLTEFMSNMMPVVMESIMAETQKESGLEGLDLSMLGFSVETGRVFATVELYDFNEVGEIEIPAAALEAEEAAA